MGGLDNIVDILLVRHALPGELGIDIAVLAQLVDEAKALQGRHLLLGVGMHALVVGANPLHDARDAKEDVEAIVVGGAYPIDAVAAIELAKPGASEVLSHAAGVGVDHLAAIVGLLLGEILGEQVNEGMAQGEGHVCADHEDRVMFWVHGVHANLDLDLGANGVLLLGEDDGLFVLGTAEEDAKGPALEIEKGPLGLAAMRETHDAVQHPQHLQEGLGQGGLLLGVKGKADQRAPTLWIVEDGFGRHHDHAWTNVIAIGLLIGLHRLMLLNDGAKLAGLVL
jgi:hypothetical protein